MNHLKPCGYPLNREIVIFLENEIVSSPRVEYSRIDLDNAAHFGIPVTMVISEEFLLQHSKRAYDNFSSFLKKDGKGTGDDYVDSLGHKGLDYLKLNDIRFNFYMLETHYDIFLDPVCRATSKNKDIVTFVSLDNLVYYPHKFIFSGKAVTG